MKSLTGLADISVEGKEGSLLSLGFLDQFTKYIKRPKVTPYFPSGSSWGVIMETLEENLKHNQGIGLIFLDIAGFTRIEQMHGHLKCQQILKVFENALKVLDIPWARGREVLIHNVSGDDFVLYYRLPEKNSMEALAFLERLAQEAKRQTLELVGRRIQQIDVEPLDLHLGYAVLRANSSLSMESLIYGSLKDAAAMAKGQFDAEYFRHVMELREAISNRNFTILYQPLVALKSGSIIGYESLCRGPADSYLHGPNNLFPLAEKAGLLYPLEKIIREKVISDNCGLKSGELIFLNINPTVVNDPEFAQGHTRRLVEKHGLMPRNICFEITERTAIQDFDKFKRVLEHYRHQGFRVAVDDAGAGYSSLQAIAELQPDFIKIDMSLIRNIDTLPVKQALMETFVTFAEKIGTQIVAEGIETREELQVLLELGVDVGQGFFLGRPQNNKEDTTSQAKDMIKEFWSLGKEETSVKSPVGALTEPAGLLDINAPTKCAIEHFSQYPDSYCLVVVDEEIPVGLVMRDKLYYCLAGQYGIALYAHRPISLVMDQNPLILDYSDSIEKASQLATSRHLQRLYDYLIVTRDEKCIGTVSVHTLLSQLTKVQMDLAFSANPLTGLPGNVRIEQEIFQLIESNKHFYGLYFDLDNFKAFNDCYGFERGDKAIKLISQLIIESVQKSGSKDALVGHIGGDDFIVLTKDKPQEICQQVINDFDRQILNLYSEEDRAKGCIQSVDREGNICTYPIITVSIGIVDAWASRFSHPVQLGEQAAIVKKAAKRIQGSTFVFDNHSCGSLHAV